MGVFHKDQHNIKTVARMRQIRKGGLDDHEEAIGGR